MEPPQRPNRNRRTAAPLYEERFEHDACGVGFVADAGGHSHDRVLPLALAGLAALGHRGAFGADGESSDGAGVALPLDRSILRLIAGDELAAERPAVVSLFLPRGRVAEARARALVETTFLEAGLTVVAWRAVPVDVGRPRGVCGCLAAGLRAGGGRSTGPGRRRPATRGRRGIRAPRWSSPDGVSRPPPVRQADPSPPSRCRPRRPARSSTRASSSAAACPTSTRTCASPLDSRYAVFHQRYATNTHPVWRLAQPFRSIAHNGEINTVRGNREQVRGRAGDAAGSGIARALLAAGPLLSEDGSDSLSLDEALELLTTTGWDLTPALLTAIPEALALRRAPHPHVATLRRRTAGFLAPWDGPAAIVFADGRHVGVLVDRNGLRPAAFAVTRDRLVAVASEAGAVPLQRVRDGPPRPARAGRAAAGRAGPTVDPRGRRGKDAGAPGAADPRCGAAGLRRPDRVVGRTRGRAARGLDVRARAALPGRSRRRTGAPRHQDDGARGSRAALEHGRRHADTGPRPPRPTRRGPPPPGVRPGHEPGHRPGARARRDGPPRRAGSPAGVAGRSATGTADRPARAPGRRRPRRPAGRRPRRRWHAFGRSMRPGSPKTAARASKGRSTGWRATP